jgi:hypothetical protein
MAETTAKAAPKKAPAKKTAAKPAATRTFLQRVQDLIGELHAPKSRRNNFGKYNYRSLDDIFMALKPLLTKHELHLSVSDEVLELGNDRVVRATATLADAATMEHQVIGRGYAGIEAAGGMSLPQGYGSASTYARKYALGGLFMLDESDSDPDEMAPIERPSKPKPTPAQIESMKATVRSGADGVRKVKAAFGKYNLTSAQQAEILKG